MGEASRIVPGIPYNVGPDSPLPAEGKEARDAAAEAGSQVTREVRGAASELASRTGQQVESQIESRKERTVEELGAVAEALRRTGQNLRGSDQEAISKYADMAAQRVDRVSGYLREHTIGEVIGEFEAFARREPAIFLGASFALGLIGGRFLKSSARPSGEGHARAHARGFR